MKKRMLIALLCLCAAILLLPTAASASEEINQKVMVAGTILESGQCYLLDNNDGITALTEITSLDGGVPTNLPDNVVLYDGETNTLTLKNATIITPDGEGETETFGICLVGGPVNMCLYGVNEVINNKNDSVAFAIYADENSKLTINTGSGEGEIPTLKTTASGGKNGNYGISANGGLNIIRSNVVSESGSAGDTSKNNVGIFVEGGCEIGKKSSVTTTALGTIDISGGVGVGMYCADNLSIMNSGTLITSSECVDSAASGVLSSASNMYNLRAAGGESICAGLYVENGATIRGELEAEAVNGTGILLGYDTDRSGGTLTIRDDGAVTASGSVCAVRNLAGTKPIELHKNYIAYDALYGENEDGAAVTTDYVYDAGQKYLKINRIKYSLNFINGALRVGDTADSEKFRGEGTSWSYNAADNILTLTDLRFTTMNSKALNIKESVNIELKGENVFKSIAFGETDTFGIHCCDIDLTIQGEGGLSAIAGDGDNNSWNIGIYIENCNFTVKDGNVAMTGGLTHGLTFNSGIMLYENSTFTISGGTVIAKGYDWAIYISKEYYDYVSGKFLLFKDNSEFLLSYPDGKYDYKVSGDLNAIPDAYTCGIAAPYGIAKYQYYLEFREHIPVDVNISVAVKPEGGGSAIIKGVPHYLKSVNATCEDEVTVVATPYFGYELRGWYIDGVRVSEDECYTGNFAADTLLTAKFIKKIMTPIILSQPKGGTYYKGETITLSVKATIGRSEGELSYLWRKDGKPVENGDKPTLIIENADADDAGEYVVSIQNSLSYTEDGENLSRSVVITGNPAVITIIDGLRGDYDGDGDVDADDAALLVGEVCRRGRDKTYDYNGDGRVNYLDILAMVKRLMQDNDADVISYFDVTKDGKITVADILKIIANVNSWKKTIGG